MWNATVDTVQIDVPRWLFRAMQSRPLNLSVSALTGVAVSFCPLSLYQFGAAGVPFGDWRVLTNYAVILVVAWVYMTFGAPVLGRAWRFSAEHSASEADGAGQRRNVKADLLFWLLFLVIGIVIWVLTAPAH